jgi:hypothetical protein
VYEPKQAAGLGWADIKITISAKPHERIPAMHNPEFAGLAWNTGNHDT